MLVKKIGMPRITPPNCIILDNWVFQNFILANEPFAKALRLLGTCVLVNNNLCEKLVTIFDERFKFPWVPFFIPDFNLLSCELDNFTFKVLYWVRLNYTKTK